MLGLDAGLSSLSNVRRTNIPTIIAHRIIILVVFLQNVCLIVRTVQCRASLLQPEGLGTRNANPSTGKLAIDCRHIEWIRGRMERSRRKERNGARGVRWTTAELATVLHLFHCWFSSSSSGTTTTSWSSFWVVELVRRLVTFS